MSGVRLLLADDTPDVRALLRLVLGRAGYDIVAEAGDGAEAVAMAEQHQPDVVIVDLAMPVMDGLEAIPLIRKQAPEAKVVVFSGFTSEGIEAEAIAAGAHAYMEKGAKPGEVVATVAGVVGGPAAVRSDFEDGLGGDGGAAGAAGDPLTDQDMSFVMHELMSPLTVIEGFAAIIEARGDSLEPGEVTEFGGRIVRSAAHLRSLIEAVSDARRLHGGSLRLASALVDVGVLVAEAARDLAAVTSPHPVIVESEPGYVVDGDAVRLRQVLANLLSNAAKFSEPAAPIEVRVTATDSHVEVAVQDEGPGIPPARRAELFRRYSRLGSEAPGMGIGLYISRGIAKAHGGDLLLADGAGGRGARFVLSLPRADAGL